MQNIGVSNQQRPANLPGKQAYVPVLFRRPSLEFVSFLRELFVLRFQFPDLCAQSPNSLSQGRSLRFRVGERTFTRLDVVQTTLESLGFLRNALSSARQKLPL